MRIVTNASAVNEMKNSVIKDNSPPQDLLVESNNTKAKPLHENDVHDAKSRFAATVSSTLSDLMVQKGYSRARATSLLLNSIRDKDEAPTDSKVSTFVTLFLLLCV